MIVGISYAAFKFVGLGTKPNTITTGAITMEYTESTNTISMNNALPTTDATGKVRLTAGEYFDFTLSGRSPRPTRARTPPSAGSPRGDR